MSETIKMKKRTYWTTETFKEEMKRINSNIKIVSEYTHSKAKIHCVCLIDNYEWDSTPNSLLRGNGCPKCSGRLAKTHDEFLNDFYTKNPNASNIDILSEYINAHTKIHCRCKIDNYEWFTTPHDLLKGHGCSMCVGRAPKTNEQFCKQMKMINNNIEILEEYNGVHTKILIRCKIDGYEWRNTPHNLLVGQGCPLCANKVVKQGINDIATLRPDLVNYFDNIKDAQSSSLKSSKKHNLHCIYCGYQKVLSNNDLVNNGFSCPICGDKISYPNKFSRAFLMQLPIEKFIVEYSPEWANGKRYDNYFEYKGNKYILEMDGGFHFKNNNLSGQTYEESRRIDGEKDELAKSHNIFVIRIDSRKSKLNYIKNNIINSELNKIFDLSLINWDSCNKFAHKNYIKEICNYYNNISTDLEMISSTYGISIYSIKEYLRYGTKNGWCYFNRDKKTNKIITSKYKPVNVFLNENLIHSFLSTRQCIIGMNKIYSNLVFDTKCIISCCRGERDSYKGFVFKYA